MLVSELSEYLGKSTDLSLGMACVPYRYPDKP